MRYIKPDYFNNFKCTADQCPDTCCAGWQIVIDEDALEKYMEEKGPFGSRLANGIDWQEGTFLQYAGRCSMLNDNNLCDLVTELGEKCLCETCQRYPRHEEEFEGLREWSLSLSCPVAAHMILESETPLKFVEEEDEAQDPLEDEFEDFDFFLFTQLEDARKVLFRIVTDRTKSMEQRLLLILEMAEQMQGCVDEDRLFDMDELVARYGGKVSDAGGCNGYGCETNCCGCEEKGCEVQDANVFCGDNRYRELKKHFQVFYRLERLRDEWSDVITDAESTLYDNQDFYEQIRREFLRRYDGDENLAKQWEQFRENFLIFFLYTYFCGAVYDDWIYSKVALSVFSLLFIEEFVMCKWFLADKNISWQECVELAYRYAREVEHSDENLNSLEEWLQENPIALKG